MRVKPGAALGVAALSLLGGCAPWTWPSAVPAAQRPAPSAASAYFDFSWELSGDRQAAPLQVFDDGHRMWLQFSPSQGEPGLWRPAPEGDLRAVGYSRQGPYLVLDQVWPALVVQAQGRQASVRRAQARQELPEPVSQAPSNPAQIAPAGPAPAATPQPAGTDVRVALSALAEPPVRGMQAAVADKPDAQKDPMPQLAPADEQAPGASYSVDRADGHMRRTVARWAQQAGWVFQAEHWSVDVDIPVVGDAVFDMPFERAVQSLLAATELSDRPLQPCFYSNKVVRVVAFAQACDRTAPPGERA